MIFSTSISTNWGQRSSKTQTAPSLKNKKVIQTLNFQRILGFIYQFQRFHLNYLTPWEATTEQTDDCQMPNVIAEEGSSIIWSAWSCGKFFCSLPGSIKQTAASVMEEYYQKKQKVLAITKPGHHTVLRGTDTGWNLLLSNRASPSGVCGGPVSQGWQPLDSSANVQIPADKTDLATVSEPSCHPESMTRPQHRQGIRSPLRLTSANRCSVCKTRN